MGGDPVLLHYFCKLVANSCRTYFLTGSVAARPTRLGNAGFAHFDLSSYFAVVGGTFGASFQYGLAVPNSPSLKGLRVVLQTLAFDTRQMNATLELSNGLEWAVGQ